MDAMDFGFDEEDDLSSALGTETLAARDMVPEGFDNTPRAHVPTKYYPIRKVVYYQAIHRQAGTGRPRALAWAWQASLPVASAGDSAQHPR
jgi:hypothetical protein